MAGMPPATMEVSDAVVQCIVRHQRPDLVDRPLVRVTNGWDNVTFRLGDDPGLERFVQKMARRIDGRVVAPEAGDLGAAVVGEYLRAHFRGRPYDDADWAK